MSPLVLILVILGIAAIIMYIFNQYIPANPSAKAAINVVIALAAVAWIVIVLVRH